VIEPDHDAFVDASHRAERWAALADPTVAASVYGVTGAPDDGAGRTP
jgi:hypothetical protein